MTEPTPIPETPITSLAGEGYGEGSIQILEGLEAVRKRPGMYIGDTSDGSGLHHLVFEVVDNSIDEALAGHCSKIQVTLNPDGSAFVGDNGRGIPVDIEPKTKLSGVEVVMTKLHAGGKFGGGSYAASGGLHGVGASVVNALSSRLDIEVDRGAKVHGMSFRRGVPGIFESPDPQSDFTRKSGLQIQGTCPRTRTGTRVRWWADRQVFTKDADYDWSALRERALQSTFLVPGLAITIRDDRVSPPVEETLQHKGGLVEYVEALSTGESVSPVIRLSGNGHFHETVPVLDDKGHMSPREVERDLQVEVAMRWDAGYDTTLRSFVNVIATPKGGTHVTGFERALVKVVNDQLKSARILKASEDSIAKDDALEGLCVVVTVRLAEPQFEGQTKEILGTPAATRIVGNVVTKELTAWFATPPRGDKQATRAVLDKVANAMRARVAARTHRDTQRRKTALESSALPAKLVDCRTDDVARSELFIVEGDSALGTAKTARNADFQALLPIRGKILNVQKASLSDMLKNSECASIIQVIGAGSGRTFDVGAARYGKIILMSDADVDGAHIRCLLLTLVHRYLRPLIDEGRVYAAVPPLHRIELVSAGSKANDVVYTYSDSEMRGVLVDAEKKGRRVKDPVQRYKGLGEMDASQLRETTMDPAKRTLRRMTMADASHAEAAFELLMGTDVGPRREFIVDGAAGLDRERIDV
jgi:DNA gyrase subunit B